MAVKTHDPAPPPAAFDLAALEAVDTEWLNVLKDGKPTGWRIQLAGPGHPETIAVQREAQAERLTKAKRIEATQVNRKKWKPEDVDADAEAREFAEQLARRIVGWDPVTINGADFPYSRANALALMSEPRWVFVQNQVVEYFLADTAFTKSSATT